MTLPVGDLERSLAFYRAALVAGMGWVELEVEGAPTFGPAEAEDVSLVPGGPLRPPIHLAFAADDFAQVEGFHREGLAAGGCRFCPPREGQNRHWDQIALLASGERTVAPRVASA